MHDERYEVGNVIVNMLLVQLVHQHNYDGQFCQDLEGQHSLRNQVVLQIINLSLQQLLGVPVSNHSSDDVSTKTEPLIFASIYRKKNNNNIRLKVVQQQVVSAPELSPRQTCYLRSSSQSGW